MSFKPVDQKVNFIELEKKWLSWWEENQIVQKYLHKNDTSEKKFSFIDGPITANNPMGIHHAWGRTYKDLWQRFKNMQGYKQRFQNGFDNQGLWVEVEVEKKLGFKSKKDIEKYGIEKFVNDCKDSTQKWSGVQTEQSKRLGYFMDWDNSYYTMDEKNNYTIWYFLKNCHLKKLLYKGRDSVPWCPRCGTAISQHEILQEEYQLITHDSVYFLLPIDNKENEYFLVWTTTPWTLPANVALAVNPKLEYWLIGYQEKQIWMAADLVPKIFPQKPKIIKKIKGTDLVGLKYRAAFDNLDAVITAKNENPETFHSVVASEEIVNNQEGTGIVHIATGCGGEDFALGKEKNLPVIAAIDESANYLEGFGELSGQNAKTNPDLILKNQALVNGFLFKIETFQHRYPVCWRCKTELVWRVVDEWYLKMDPIRERIKSSVGKAAWYPSWSKERENDWLDHMSDWLISKKRYWGLALPIWECLDCGSFEVIGSLDELKEKACEGLDKFIGHSPHRPWIDEVKIKCSTCGKPISRIKDVGNPWLDAGIVPFSTLVDPQSKKVSYLDDKKYWQEWFPADFVTECFPGQFKNWFYSILTMSTVLEDNPPFKTLFGYALVKDEKGEEMHKSKSNVIWFDDAVEKIGVDVMRWMYLVQNPVLNLNFGYKIADETRRKFFLMLWNIYNFFVSYANLDQIDLKDLTEEKSFVSVLDRWIISRLNDCVLKVTGFLENYDPYNASLEIEKLVNDFSTWFVRRSRDRVGPSVDNTNDKTDCYRAFYQVLLTLTKLLAPFTPFLSEEIFKNLTDQPSVHLQDWPISVEKLIDIKLQENMTQVRKICEMGHAKRKEAAIKVRQPLSKITVTNLSFEDGDLLSLIKSELNIKSVENKMGEADLTVELDLKITPALEEEGEARDIIRQVQEARKESGCLLSEKINLELPQWPKSFEKEIKNKTLSENIIVSPKLKIVRHV